MGGLALLLLPVAACAQNALRWTTNYYSITGATLVELRRSLDEARPWKGQSDSHAWTDWRIEWRFNTTPTPGGCQCRSFTTKCTIINTFPRWTPPTNAPQALRQTWARYLSALGQHEAGHAQLGLAAVADIHKGVKELGEQPECEDLRKKINQIAQSIMEDYRNRDREYDQRTRHGESQGASLPLGIHGGRQSQNQPLK